MGTLIGWAGAMLVSLVFFGVLVVVDKMKGR